MAPEPNHRSETPSSSSAGWVGGYHLLEPIGAGGSSTVWRAKDEGGDTVALKLLHPSLAMNDSARRRLVRETRLVNSIPGGGVARVLDLEIDALTPFVVTELVEGETLEESVRGDHGTFPDPFTTEELAALAQNLGDILERVHSAGIAHRDLKPSNVILSDDGPVLIDFGIAQGDEDSRLTTAGLLQGTPGYVAPELLSGSDPDADQWKRGDWFGWAGLLCFATTGRHPFGTGRPEAILRRVAEQDVDTNGIREPLASAFRQALSPNPETRLAPRDLKLAIENTRTEDGTTLLAADGARDLSSDAENPTTDLSVTDILPSTPTVAFIPHALESIDISGSEPGQLVAETHSSPLVGEGPDALPWMENLAYQHPRPRPSPILSILLLGVIAWSVASLSQIWLLAPYVLLLIFGIAGRIEDSVGKRREVWGGPRSSDKAVTLAWSPWHVFVSVLALLPGIAAGLIVFLVAGSIGQFAVHNGGSGTVEPFGFWNWVSEQAGAVTPSTLVVGAAGWLGLIVAWALPWSRWTRLGMDRWFAFSAPTRSSRVLWALVFATTVVLLMIVAVLNSPMDALV